MQTSNGNGFYGAQPQYPSQPPAGNFGSSSNQFQGSNQAPGGYTVRTIKLPVLPPSLARHYAMQQGQGMGQGMSQGMGGPSMGGMGMGGPAGPFNAGGPYAGPYN